MLNAVNLEWQDLPLGRLLETRYKVPVTILNDSQATAIGEYVYDGAQQVDSSLVVVNVGQGIGRGHPDQRTVIPGGWRRSGRDRACGGATGRGVMPVRQARLPGNTYELKRGIATRENGFAR